jgi:hypothetical protein
LPYETLKNKPSIGQDEELNKPKLETDDMDNSVKQRVTETAFVQDLPPDIREAVVETIVNIGNLRDLSEGDELFQLNDRSDGLGCVLLEGSVHVASTVPSQTSRQAPALFGEIAYLHPMQRRTATLTAEQPAKVLEFVWADFRAEIEKRLNRAQQDEVLYAIQRLAGYHTTT